ncbi:hypothetical protein [Arthrobacter sp. TE12232]
MGTPIDAVRFQHGVGNGLGLNFGQSTVVHAAPVKLADFVIRTVQQNVPKFVRQHCSAFLSIQPSTHLNLALGEICETTGQPVLCLCDVY